MFKTVSTIFLLLLLSFHWYGYRLVIGHFQRVADQQLELSLDANVYNENELIEISTPLNMPYQNNFSEFERCYGEIEINNSIYTYVKRRVIDGVLVLKCIPHTKKQAIRNAGIDFFQNSNGPSDRSNDKGNTALAKVLKNMFCDYEDLSQNFGLNLFYRSALRSFAPAAGLSGANLPIAGQPPDRFC